MKIIVIGGSGFIGSHVADFYSDNGHKVTILDKKKSQWLKKNQKMIVGDIKNDKLLNKSLKNIDVVYHCAGLSDLNESINKPIETIEENILATAKLLHYSVKHKIKRFIFASSIYVYSKHGGFYRCSKQAAENYIDEFSKNYKLNYTILRYGSIYGPRSNSSNGLYKIIENALKKNTITYRGNEDSIREYIHVKDLARSSIKILDKQFVNKCLTLTGSEKINVKDVLKMISEIIGIKKIKFSKNKEIGHYRISPYSYLPKPALKLNNQVECDLGQGLLELVDYVSEDLNDKK